MKNLQEIQTVLFLASRHRNRRKDVQDYWKNLQSHSDVLHDKEREKGAKKAKKTGR